MYLNPTESYSTGLSPRVRGNLRREIDPIEECGSIPAGAGESTGKFQVLGCKGVYPRGCGGIFNVRADVSGVEGLSPRVRGNLFRWRGGRKFNGSIPAGAGESQTAIHQRHILRVYPRGCGGILKAVLCCFCRKGLSPRVRGNPAETA